MTITMPLLRNDLTVFMIIISCWNLVFCTSQISNETDSGIKGSIHLQFPLLGFLVRFPSRSFNSGAGNGRPVIENDCWLQICIYKKSDKEPANWLQLLSGGLSVKPCSLRATFNNNQHSNKVKISSTTKQVKKVHLQERVNGLIHRPLLDMAGAQKGPTGAIV